MKKLVCFVVLGAGMSFILYNVSYAANWIRSGNVVEKTWSSGKPMVAGVLEQPPPNNNDCSGGDQALTFNISILARLAGDQFDVNKIYVDGMGSSGNYALDVWLTDWYLHGHGYSLPSLIVNNNWSGVNTISVCVGSIVQGLTFDQQLQSIFFWYNGNLSTTQQPFPIGRPGGDPMDMSKTDDALSVANNGVRVSDLNGSGITTRATDSQNPNKPDFIVNRNWLETVGGVEQYVFSKNDEIKMKGQFKNIGDGEIPNDATIHSRVYLSKGYKEVLSNQCIV